MTTHPMRELGPNEEPGREAEHALVAALVLGHADPADLSGRLSGRDFFDRAAGLIFDTVLTAARRGAVRPGEALTALRTDGYPIRPLLDWLPRVSVPAHPQAWSALVVASALSRQVEAAGVRLQQAAGAYSDLPYGAGRVLAVAAAQRATVHAALMRWEELPASWRHTLHLSPQGLPPAAPRPTARVGGDELILERELLAGLIAAPELLSHIRWLQPTDFADPAHGELFTVVRQLHDEGRPIDLVTVAAALPLTTPTAVPGLEPETPAAPPEVVLEVCRRLQPHQAFPGMIPWIARQQLEASMLREAGSVGVRLTELAATPVAIGGVGAPVLRQAVRVLDEFGDQSRRLEAATRTAPSSADSGMGTGTGSPRPRLLPSLDPTCDTAGRRLRLAPSLDDAQTVIDLTVTTPPELGGGPDGPSHDPAA